MTSLLLSSGALVGCGMAAGGVTKFAIIWLRANEVLCTCGTVFSPCADAGDSNSRFRKASKSRTGMTGIALPETSVIGADKLNYIIGYLFERGRIESRMD